MFAIARQESAFNPRAVSSANALGLMQVLPGTGKQIAKKFGFAFDRNRMLSDASYNAQMGAAELGDVLESYRGSYILSFVAYNAGRGRVKQWIEKYGDPRDPSVDPIDWVERIPFSETRNYVQRVLENMQVYRAQLGIGSRLMIEADLRRGASRTDYKAAALPYAPRLPGAGMGVAEIVKEPDADETGFTSLFVSAQDGLRLHVRRYGDASGADCRSSACPASPATERTSMSSRPH